MLADEPVSSLDPRLAERVLGYLADVTRADGIPTVVNLHTVSLARRFATRVIGLSAGRLVVDEPIAALDQPDVLERIYGGSGQQESFEPETRPAPVLMGEPFPGGLPVGAIA